MAFSIAENLQVIDVAARSYHRLLERERGEPVGDALGLEAFRRRSRLADEVDRAEELLLGILTTSMTLPMGGLASIGASTLT